MLRAGVLFRLQGNRKDKQQREKGKRAIPRQESGDLNYESKYTRVCANHFDASYIVTAYDFNINGDAVSLKLHKPTPKADAVPGIFEGLPSYLTKRKPRSHSSTLRPPCKRPRESSCEELRASRTPFLDRTRRTAEPTRSMSTHVVATLAPRQYPRRRVSKVQRARVNKNARSVSAAGRGKAPAIAKWPAGRSPLETQRCEPVARSHNTMRRDAAAYTAQAYHDDRNRDASVALKTREKDRPSASNCKARSPGVISRSFLVVCLLPRLRWFLTGKRSVTFTPAAKTLTAFRCRKTARSLAFHPFKPAESSFSPASTERNPLEMNVYPSLAEGANASLKEANTQVIEATRADVAGIGHSGSLPLQVDGASIDHSGSPTCESGDDGKCSILTPGIPPERRADHDEVALAVMGSVTDRSDGDQLDQSSEMLSETFRSFDVERRYGGVHN
ncbi:hypothetical protein HPB52_023205 [Rhipicephalus sanguineus]|uniref:THAP-type domain-containing protein n=1 Tax=Rhipicephalus sanguineus TaxID=34632 RepID=A0A9D4T827_RHISA|nr:hypothetical protein HPB52_023205 [Rhipicephalus sanguineus]